MCDPTLVAIAMVASTGMQIAGQQQQAKQASQEAAYKNAVLDNQRAVIQSDNVYDAQQQEVRNQIIAEETLRATGRAEVQFASLGQQLAFGSSASDILGDISAEGAFKTSVSVANQKLRERNRNIQVGNLGAEARLNMLRAEGARATANLQGLGAAAALGVQAGSTFKFDKAGKFVFRTKPIR
jgi:hypothetical protein